MQRLPLSLPLIGLAIALLPRDALAASFYISSPGIRGMARGGAFVAAPDDVSAIIYNPAALSLLRGLQIETDLEIVDFGFQFQRSCPCTSAADPTSAMDDAHLMQLFAHHPAINHRGPQPIPFTGIAYGFDWMKLTIAAALWGFPAAAGINFGPTTGPAALGQPQRYSLISSDLLEALGSFGVGLEILPGLRVGAAASLFYFTSEQRLHFWGNSDLAGAPEETDLDVGADLKFSSPLLPTFGLGVSWDIIGGLSAGASVVGQRSMRADGTVGITPPPAFKDLISVQGKDIQIEANLPPVYRAGVQYAFKGWGAIEAAFALEAWSVQQRLRIRSRDVVIVTHTPGGMGMMAPFPTIDIDRSSRNAPSFHLGGELTRFMPWLSIQAGYFFEKAAVDAEHLDVTGPDMDKHGFSLGVATTWNGFRLGLGGQYVLLDTVTVSDSARRIIGPLAPPSGSSTYLTATGNGTYSGNYFIFGASLGFTLDDFHKG